MSQAPITRLAELRTARRLTQNELAVWLKVSLTTVAKLENATTINDLGGFRFDLLCRVARRLHVAPADLIPLLREVA